MLQTTMF